MDMRSFSGEGDYGEVKWWCLFRAALFFFFLFGAHRLRPSPYIM